MRVARRKSGTAYARRWIGNVVSDAPEDGVAETKVAKETDGETETRVDHHGGVEYPERHHETFRVSHSVLDGQSLKSKFPV